jgi:hypothetical protein
MINPYMQQAIVPPAVQQMQQQQHVGVSIKVSGRDEAMNRLLMMYPANMLVPGFISDAIFDVNGRQFHALSIEADDSRSWRRRRSHGSWRAMPSRSSMR